MKLLLKGTDSTQNWKDAGFSVPAFDVEAVRARTRSAPTWIHFGAGNIFRAFPAAVHQELLDKGLADTGIIVAEGFDAEIIERAYRPFDNLSVLVTLKADGSIDKKLVASVTESLAFGKSADVTDLQGPDTRRLKEIFIAPGLQMASFTITEKGYSLRDAKGELLSAVKADIEGGPEKTISLMGTIASLLFTRFVAQAGPLALVSMDNCSHNGDKLKAAVFEVARTWHANGFVGADFIAWLEDPAKLSFPWSMIDKITPRPDSSVQEMLKKAGFEDTEIIVTARQTWTAAFVNAEEAQYLVIEDRFPNGRPPLEKAGILFADRETVDKVERMKVTTCLNPLHTALAVTGCLLGYTSIHREMKDSALVKLVKRIGYTEGLPVVVNPGILDPKSFIDDVVERRLPNPFMPDTPQRIACDTSQKVPIRFGQTIRAWADDPARSTDALEGIPFAIACWLRYLCAKDDALRPFELSPDPLLPALTPAFADLDLTRRPPAAEVHQRLEPILSRADLFACNLYRAGLGQKIEGLFAELCAGPGAVRKTLDRVSAKW